MTMKLIKYLVAFIFGALCTYFAMSIYSKNDTSSEVSVLAPESLNCEKHTSTTTTSELASVETGALGQENLESNDFSLNSCEEQINELTQRVAATEQSRRLSEKSLIDQLSQAKTEALILQQRLNAYEPSTIDEQELKEMVLAPFNSRIVGLPQDIKESIYDFHKREDDLDWGYMKQQQISDFIRSHLNYEFVNLLSVICKVDTCEVAMSEKQNVDSLASNGASQEEIQALINSSEPKYKAIFDDMRISPEIDMNMGVYMPGRFDVYMFMNKRKAPPTPARP